MMVFLRNMGFSRFESLLGLAVVAVVVTVALPRMKAEIEVEQGQRAEIEARDLAETILEYHLETGTWPHAHNGQADLTRLTLPERNSEARAASAGLLGALVSDPAWLPEVPLDPWNRPYTAFVPEDESGMILVISAGRNGILETDRDQLAKVCQAGRIGTGPVLTGDDIGYLQLETHPTGQP